ncbi:MAG: MFS transporter [Treponema sp.]|nr:MFS transporter [Treponema sp.]
MLMAVPDFILFMVVSVVTVYLPLFLRVFGYTTTQTGLLLAVFNAAGIIIPLLVTPVMSRAKRLAPVLLIVAAGMAVMPVPLFHWHGFAITASVLALYAAFYRSAIPVCDTMINNSLGVHRERYGYVRVSGSTGFVIMSLILQHFIVLEKSPLFEMTAWMSIPAVLLTFTILPFTMSKKFEQKNVVAEEKQETEKFREIITSFGSGYFLILFVIFMQYMGMVPANQFLSLYLKDSLKSNASGFMWALNAVCEIPFMFLSGRFIRRYGPLRLIFICTAAVSVRMAFYAFIPNLAGVVMGQIMHSLTFGLFYPSCITWCAQSAHTSRSVVISMTLFTVVGSLANAIGSSLGGWLIDTAGYRNMFCIFGLMPLAGLAVYRLLKQK